MTRCFAAVVVTFCLCACATPSEYASQSAAARELLESARAGASKPQSQDIHIRHESSYFVPALRQAGQNAPGWFNLPVQFVFSEYPLRNALLDITSPLGVSVRLLDDIDPTIPLTMQHSGTLAEAIQQIALATGLSFIAEDRLLTWRQYEVAEFDVAFLSGMTNFFLGGDGSTMTAPSTPQGGQGFSINTGLNDDSGQYLNFASDALSVWDDLERALRLLISQEGEIAINQSTTSVLVRDLPQYVQQVREYLVQQNERLTRQVAIDVQVIDVTFMDSQQSAIDWNLLYQATQGTGEFRLDSSGIQAPRDGLQFGYERLQGPMSGSQLLLRALSQQGVVKVNNHPRLVTLNNQISKIILEDNVTYLASAGSSSTANVGSNDLLIPGVVRTGFELYLLPKVANNQVLLQLSTSLSDLKTINEVSSGDTTIQTPQTSRKKFFMKAMVQNQESLLISGLQNTRSQYQQERSLVSRLFGGSRIQGTQQTETILILTPRILPSGSIL